MHKVTNLLSRTSVFILQEHAEMYLGRHIIRHIHDIGSETKLTPNKNSVWHIYNEQAHNSNLC